MNDIIAQKLKDLPAKPGVYIMYSDADQILYIGKARSLKNRVRQYFGTPTGKSEKVLIMVSKIHHFDYLITHNEIEALVLENNLIKKHKPPYNILLKDDKNYPFIRINLKDTYPKVEVVRTLKKDGAKYFGPYMQGINAKEILEMIHSAFKLRTCSLNMAKIPAKHRACLNHHIERCLAPCINGVQPDEYMEIIAEVVKFLQGSDKSIEKLIKDKMLAAVEREEFELAIYYRERLRCLEKLIRKQVTALPNDMDMDIFAIASDGINTVVAIFVVRGGKLLGGDKEVVNTLNIDDSTTLENYILGYYGDNVPICTEIITNIALDNSKLLCEYLTEVKGRKVNISCPIQSVRKQLADMAENNARDYLSKCKDAVRREYDMTVGAIMQLQDMLKLDSMPIRMECYDISHISGVDKVSSMVVFTNGRPDKRMYRKFKIKTVEGNNDFACMKETFSRRLAHIKDDDMSFGVKPDLVVIDGGKGQLKYALEAMFEIGVNLPIIALAEREDEIYIPNQSEPIVLPRNSQALKVLQRLRDEAHRFAITYHRGLRDKRQTNSELLKIEGVGSSTVKKLFEHYKTINAIKLASVTELKQIKGVTSKAAKNIYDFFHSVID